MTIDAALTIVLLISLGCNILAAVYIRDILGRLGWLTQNLANLTQLIRGFQNHIRSVHEHEKFYGDEDLKFVVNIGCLKKLFNGLSVFLCFLVMLYLRCN